MKKLLIMAAALLVLAGCSTQRNMGGSEEDAPSTPGLINPLPG